MSVLNKPVRIPEEVLLPLEQNRIPRENLEKTILHGIESGMRILNADNQHITCHNKIGRITCWVEYTEEETCYQVHKAYFHRVNLEEDHNG